MSTVSIISVLAAMRALESDSVTGSWRTVCARAMSPPYSGRAVAYGEPGDAALSFRASLFAMTVVGQTSRPAPSASAPIVVAVLLCVFCQSQRLMCMPRFAHLARQVDERESEVRYLDSPSRLLEV
jgi:hypothetical protein